MSEKHTDPVVAALLREHAGYVARGLDDRAGLVAEQLRLRGHEIDPAPAPDPDPDPDKAAQERAKAKPGAPQRATQKPKTTRGGGAA